MLELVASVLGWAGAGITRNWVQSLSPTRESQRKGVKPPPKLGLSFRFARDEHFHFELHTGIEMLHLCLTRLADIECATTEAMKCSIEHESKCQIPIGDAGHQRYSDACAPMNPLFNHDYLFKRMLCLTVG
jgi:hypothetical protein